MISGTESVVKVLVVGNGASSCWRRESSIWLEMDESLIWICGRLSYRRMVLEVKRDGV